MRDVQTRIGNVRTPKIPRWGLCWPMQMPINAAAGSIQKQAFAATVWLSAQNVPSNTSFCLPVPRWAMGHQRRQLQVSQWRFAAAFAAVMVAVDCRWKGETCGSQINPVQSSGGVSGKPPFFRQLSRSVVGHCRPPGGPNPQSGTWAMGQRRDPGFRLHVIPGMRMPLGRLRLQCA